MLLYLVISLRPCGRESRLWQTIGFRYPTSAPSNAAASR